MDLDIKYWGLVSLSKLGGILGIPIKTDKYTMDKTRLNYASLLIDIPVNVEFPNFIDFVNDQEVVVRLQRDCEWKPIKCPHCRVYGHHEDDFRKKTSARQEWRKVPMQLAQEKETEESSNITSGQETAVANTAITQSMDVEGFTPLQWPLARHHHNPRNNKKEVRNQNPFVTLQELQGEQDIELQKERFPLNGQDLQLEY